MSLPSELLPVGLLGTGAVAAEGYAIERSVRFNSSDSASLSQSVSGSTTTYTSSMWLKRSAVGNGQYQHFFFSRGGNGCGIGFDPADRITVYNSAHNLTDAVYRDPSAWYHILLSVNSGTATLYVNGAVAKSGVTGFEWSNTATIGRYNISAAYYFNGYIADVYLVDGQALTPSSFTETDANGIIQPVAYSGSYGTRGFHLPFDDNSTAAALGYDAAGSNDWTVNNISVAAGAGNDSLVDVPTNGTETDTGVGGEVRGNYCTWNPVASTPNILSNGNLETTFTNASSAPFTRDTAVGSIAVSSGKYYWEVDISGTDVDKVRVGIFVNSIDYSGAPVGFRKDSGNLNNTSAKLGLALDVGAGTLKLYENNTLTYTETFTANSLCIPVIAFRVVGGGSAASICNFGQRPFAYTAPSGFKALCTANLPAPTIEDGSTAMDVVTYTGNGSTQTISGLNFSPDFVWVKNRSTNNGSRLADTVRGVTKFLISNNANAEDTNAQALQSFTADGFTVGSNQGYNTNSDSYVAWNWDGGSSTVTNTDGSITSTVRANASAGISIISYTGNGTSGATVGHGLNVAPSFYICKFRNTNASNGPWYVYHKSLGATKGLTLNTTDAESTLSSLWNDTEPTSTVFSLGNAGDTNGSGRNFISYAFAPVSGFSAFGSYIGNGNADGPFVYTGFRPAFVLVKMSSSTGDWTILDSIREGYNVDNDPLYANLNNAEGTADLVDITSNGFKVRTTDATFNTNAGTYVYAAFAENPFQYARAR